MKKSRILRSSRSKDNQTTTPKMDKFDSLIVDSGEYKTELTNKYKNRKPYEKSDEGKMSAFIPGTVISVHVEEGQEVQKDELLVVLEAMKMLNQIKAPFSGRVKKINVKQHERVSKSHVLLELEYIPVPNV